MTGSCDPMPSAEAAALLQLLADPGVPLEERAAAGDRLGALGDVRARERVSIPAGPFLTGPPDRPVEIELDAFEIDRYPVTVAAFSLFLESGGYRDARYWSRPGWEWRAREDIEAPRFWGEEEWASYLIPNHPVVGVSFHEAEAYARFAGMRLPTQREWEKACRGTDGRPYPWGGQWQDDACGMRGVGPRGTRAIGIFPGGVSPFGVHDMVGCVWQWCVDAYEGPGLGPGARVTRGGAWNNLPRLLTCTSQNGYLPAARFSNLGFRCVV
jgi:gamma-glutamyl hercynylcysteine S-oxide synthase